jgi:hypothetical protein
MIDSQEIFRMIEYVMKAAKWSEDNDDVNYDIVGYGLFDGYKDYVKK